MSPERFVKGESERTEVLYGRAIRRVMVPVGDLTPRCIHRYLRLELRPTASSNGLPPETSKVYSYPPRNNHP